MTIPFQHLIVLLGLLTTGLALSAQTYKAERLRAAVKATKLQFDANSLLPDTTFELKAYDGRTVSLRTNAMGEVEHAGIPLFGEMMRLLQPSPVYDFLEYAVLNWKYKVNPNQLYLSKVIFKLGSWNTLLSGRLDTCDCSISNRDDKLYVVTWTRGGRPVATIGIPIDYELLNNDTRRNMERAFVRNLEAFKPLRLARDSSAAKEDDLSIYGTGGLFVLQGKSYIIDILNQNTYYTLTTVREFSDSTIHNEPVTMTLETVVPRPVRDVDFPRETFANIMMCGKADIPDATIELDFHLSDYHRHKVRMPMSYLRAFCRQQGCDLFFACDDIQEGKAHGVMFASNLPRGYNHLLSLRTTIDQLTADTPTVKADVYLYIPPISKEKLFGIAPKKKSNANIKTP